MLENWPKYSKNHKRKRERCQKGIPDSFRSEAWQRLADSRVTSNFSSNGMNLMKSTSSTSRINLFAQFVGSSISLRSENKIKPLNMKNIENSKKKLTLSASTDQIPPSGPNNENKKSFNSLVRKFSIRKRNEVNAHVDSSTSSSSGYQSKSNQHPGIPRTIQESLIPKASDKKDSNVDNNGQVIYSTYSTPVSSLGSSSKNRESYQNAYDSRDRISPYVESTVDDEWLNANSNEGNQKKLSQHGQSSVSLASIESEISIKNFYHNSCDEETKKSQTKESTLVPNDLHSVLNDDPIHLYSYYKSQKPDEQNIIQIEKDIDRQFPFHEMFAKKERLGQSLLRDLLIAYTIRNPNDGYCQGQAPIAAVLLMYMPEVNAFWTFVQICEKYLPKYYVDDLEVLLIDGEILYGLLCATYKPVYKHLVKLEISPSLIMIDWFMCIYSRNLPWQCFLRVMDMFLCEGKIVLYKVGITLLKRLFGTSQDRKKYQENDEALMRIRQYPLTITDTSKFIEEVIECPISFSMIAKETLVRSKQFYEKKKLKK